MKNLIRRRSELWVREIDLNLENNSDEKIEKILVCITAQSNSVRLIDRAAKVADENNGELHILHVLRGNNVFNNSETLALLQRLFMYGGGKGGMIHAFCNDDVCKSISDFVLEENITKVVLGEPPSENVKKSKKHTESFFDKIVKSLPKSAQIIIVEKEDKH